MLPPVGKRMSTYQIDQLGAANKKSPPSFLERQNETILPDADCRLVHSKRSVCVGCLVFHQRLATKYCSRLNSTPRAAVR